MGASEGADLRTRRRSGCLGGDSAPRVSRRSMLSFMAASSPEKQRYETEEWFRLQGLPYFVKPRDRSKHLLARCAPALLFFALFGLGWAISSHFSIMTDDADELSDFKLALFFGILALITLGPLIIALVANRFLRHRTLLARSTAILSIVLLLIVNQLVMLGAAPADWWQGALENVLPLIAVLLLTWLGIGSLLGWSLRAAIRQLSAIWLLAAIALPLLILVVISVFYAQEFWQMAAALQRGQIFWLIVFLLGIGMLFVIYSTRKELRDMPETLTPDLSASELLGSSPQTPLRQGSWQKLGGAERVNVVFIMVLAQCIQVLIFGMLVFAFIMALNALSIPPQLAVQWAGKPETNLQIFGFGLPVPEVPVRVAAFLSAIAALNFVVSINTSKDYRDAFFDPLILQTQQALSVQAGYQAGLAAELDATGQATGAAARGRPAGTVESRAEAVAAAEETSKLAPGRTATTTETMQGQQPDSEAATGDRPAPAQSESTVSAPDDIVEP